MKIKDKLLLRPEDFEPYFSGWKIDGIFNPGVVRMKDGKIVLFVRVAESLVDIEEKARWSLIVSEDEYEVKKIKESDIAKKDGNMIRLKSGLWRLLNISHFRRVFLDESGFNVDRIEQKPVFKGLPDDGNLGVEDPRIVKIGGRYVMTYVTVSTKEGISTSMAFSDDLEKWERKGIIFRKQNKDVVLFPEKIGGKYAALHRPEGFMKLNRPSIWISYSPDLTYWGREKSIIETREDSWDMNRVGSGPPPMKTEKGWLLVYHGVKGLKKKRVYSAGAVLLDLKNPEKVLARTPKEKPLLAPETNYETEGFVNRVVFPTGLIRDLDGKNVLLFCGGADRYISVKRISVQDILDSLEYY